MTKDFRLPPSPVITGAPQQKPVTNQKAVKTGNQSFKELLGQAVSQAKTQEQAGLTLSKHAQMRAGQRGIELTSEDMRRIDSAVGKAGEKGVTDTLVFMNNTAFIVNVPSRVVVTIVDGQEFQENIFTNINGAVIL